MQTIDLSISIQYTETCAPTIDYIIMRYLYTC